MPLGDHLRELRGRIVRSLLAVLLGAVVGYAAFPAILDVLLGPYCDAVGRGDACDLIVLGPLDPFLIRLRVALVVGLFLGAPVIAYQSWRFITPGLTGRERRYVLPFVVLSQVMFALGLVSASWVIPRGLSFLLALGGESIRPLLTAGEYLSFLLAMGVAFGIVFELPLVLTFLALIGVVTADGMRRVRRYAIVGLFIFAAVITPPLDAFTFLLVAGSMVLFYELAIVLAALIERTRRRRPA